MYEFNSNKLVILVGELCGNHNFYYPYQLPKTNVITAKSVRENCNTMGYVF